MKVSVKVVPDAKREQIQAGLDGSLKVWLRARPKEGKANQALTELLSKYYSVSRSQIHIISGRTSRNKIVEIEK